MATEKLYKPGEFNAIIEAAVSYFIVVCEQTPDRARMNAEVWYHLKVKHLFVSATSVESASCSFWPDDEKDNQVFHG